MTVQFFGININITIGLPAHLYATSYLRITAKVNEHLIQTLLNAESKINMMNYKVVEVYDISISCEITFKMQTADSGKASFYSYAENVEVKMIDITSTLFIFVTKKVENELILEHL